MTKLMNVMDSVQNVAEAIGAVLNVDVAILDREMTFIGATDRYKDRLGYTARGHHISSYVLETGKTVIIDDPGENTLCEPCVNYLECLETLEINCPIIHEDEIVGMIAIKTYSEGIKDYITREKDNYLKFIDNLSLLITGKIAEYDKRKELSLLNNKHRTIIDTVHEGIIVTDQSGSIVLFNQAAENMTNLKMKDIANKSVDDIFPEMKLYKVLRTSKPIYSQEIILYRNGTKMHYLVSASPIINEDTLTNMVVTFIDISQMKNIAYRLVTQDFNYSFDSILGKSQSIREVILEAKNASISESNVLILGESGTGKELFARAIHNESPKYSDNFVAINCAAIPDTLIESELFGYEEGAFSGAKKGGKIGKFEFASGGTIFLDEIGDMPLHLQARLLRVIQEREVVRIGGTESIPVDVRIIAATNQDLEQAVQAKTFREDLYYRLNVIPIFVPPIRQRMEDIPLFIDHFIRRYCQILGVRVKELNSDVKNLLYSYHWPGNVRELQNVIEYAVNMAKDATISMHHLPKKLRKPDFVSSDSFNPDLKKLSVNNEKKVIEEALNKYGWSTSGKKKAAEVLNISLSTLYRRLK